MSDQELNYRDLARQLRLGELPVVEPSSDLWSRIASAHQAAGRRRQRLRVGVGLSAFAALVLVAIVASTGQPGRSGDDVINWQARAQALELQLRAQDAIAGTTVALDAESELAHVDRALQAAYDDGTAKDRMTILWKRRSELLGTLLDARRQHTRISRI